VTFEERVEELRRGSVQHGTMDWDPITPLRAALTKAEVPHEAGVYVLRALKGQDATVVYVGRAGTLQNDGTFMEQKMWGRLQAKQEKVSRQAFFRRKLAVQGYRKLRIDWFQTWGEGTHRVPALGEAELIQAYLDDHGRLPPWNAEF
jgi:hypothetical protein